MTDIVERLRAECTDWDGSKMDARTEPMPTLRCGLLYEAADEIERLRLDAARYRKWRSDYTGEQISDLLIALADTWTPDQVDAAIDAAMKG